MGWGPIMGRARRWLPLVGLGLVAALLARIDPVAVGRALCNVDPVWLAAAVALSAAEMGLRAQLLRHLAGGRLDLPAALRATLVGHALGFATPARAGDLGKSAWLVSEGGLAPGQALRVAAADRVLLAGGLAAWACLGLGLHLGRVGPAAVAATTAMAAGAALGWALVRARPGATLLGAGTWALHLARGWCLAGALGLQLPLLPFMALGGAAALAEALPLSVLGLGVREWSLAILLAPLGVGLDEVVALSLVGLALGAAWVIPGLACTVPRVPSLRARGEVPCGG